MNPEFTFGPHYEPGLIGANGRLTRFCKGNSSTQSNPNNSQTVNDSRIGASEGALVNTGSGALSQSIVNNNVSGDIIAANNNAIARIAETAADTSSAAVKDAVYGNQLVSQTAVNATADAAKDISYTAGQVSKTAIGTVGDVAKDTTYTLGQVAKDAAGSASKAASDAAYSAQKAAEAAISGNTTVSRDALDFGSKIGDTAIRSVESQAYESQLTARKGFDFARENTRDVLDFGANNVDDALKFAAGVQKESNDLTRYTNEQFTANLARNAGDAPQTTVDNIVKYVTIAGTILGAVALFWNSRKKA